jgi:hypothetical protein
LPSLVVLICKIYFHLFCQAQRQYYSHTWNVQQYQSKVYSKVSIRGHMLFCFLCRMYQDGHCYKWSGFYSILICLFTFWDENTSLSFEKLVFLKAKSGNKSQVLLLRQLCKCQLFRQIINCWLSIYFATKIFSLD